MTYSEKTLKEAHKCSIFNRKAIESSSDCGCFNCLTTFPSSEVDWIQEVEGKEDTAACPKCGIDSVLGDSQKYSLDEIFLMAMRDYWMGPYPDEEK